MTDQEKEMCAQWWANRLEIEEKRDEFKQALLPKLHDGMFLRADYDPGSVLLEALNDAGIVCRGSPFSAVCVFPSKTRMDIRHYGKVIKANEGYGSGFVPLIKDNPSELAPVKE